VSLAARGTRNLDAGEEAVAEAALRRRLRWRALWIYARSVAIGAAAAGVGWALPG
jgi:hypothetical protein